MPTQPKGDTQSGSEAGLKRLAVAVTILLMFTAALIFVGTTTNFNQRCSDAIDSVEFEFTERQSGEGQVVTITHTGGSGDSELLANRTFVQTGSQAKAWTELAPERAYVFAGVRVNVTIMPGTQIHVYYQPPPDDPCLSGNLTLDQYTVSGTDGSIVNSRYDDRSWSSIYGLYTLTTTA